jgi:hypothetical protein
MGYSVHRIWVFGTLALSKRLLVSTLRVHSLLIGPDHYLSSPALVPSLQSQARPAIIPFSHSILSTGEATNTYIPHGIDHAYGLRLCLVIEACTYGCLCGGNKE